jgi:signal peptidase II
MIAVTRSGWLAFAVAAVVIVVDQALKAWVVGGLGLLPGDSHTIVWPLSFTLVGNDGISFGFFQTHAPWTRWALALFALVMSVVLVLVAHRAEKAIVGIALGLILGGAVGNLIDRVRIGVVVDFIDVHPLFFPWIFNVADAGITVGATVWILHSLLSPQRARP